MVGRGAGCCVAMGFAVIHKYEGSKLSRIPQLSQAPRGYPPKPSPRSQIHVCQHEIQAEGMLCSSKLTSCGRPLRVNEEISMR